MSKMQNNPIIQKAKGMLGGTVVFREVRGQVIMANRPKATEKAATVAQEDVRQKFKSAAAYAKKQMEIPESKADYETGITSKKFTAYNVAMTDFLKPPVIRGLDSSAYTGTVGQIITVKAIDDFRVEEVSVTIFNAAGELLEQGEAHLVDGTIEDWSYSITAANPATPGTKINVKARDKARNVTVEEFVL